MYESFYHLTGKPFQLSPDPAFYYGSRVHKRAYAYLEYGLYQGEGFIVITGEVGAGKTTLVRSLLANLDQNKVVAAHLVSTQLDADDVLRAVCAAFGTQIKGTDKASLLHQLEAFLRNVALENKRALLVVDEAQNLTPRAVEELRMLSNFQIGERALLQSFLIGQPELRQMMQGPDMQQVRQRVIASYHLGPLDREETQAYIEHRLKFVGWTGDPRIDDEAYDAIFAFTAGIPRRINLVCNRLMLAGFLNEMHVLNAENVEGVVKELKEELGVINTESSHPSWTDPADATPAAQAVAPAAVEQRVVAQPDERLLKRVTRLERGLSAVLTMLQRTAQSLEKQDKPSAERATKA